MNHPVDKQAVKKLLQSILANGQLAFSKHAREEMDKDQLTEVDVVNVLRAGLPLSPEMVKQTWRYRMQTQKIRVVVAFRSDTEAVVVTAWRLKK